MSHTMNIKVELADRNALCAACGRLGIPMQEGSFRLYSSTEKGVGLFLNGWKYPAVLKNNNTLAYDIDGGLFGKKEELTKLMNYYGLEKAKAEARKKGYTYYETTTQDGHPQLRIQIEAADGHCT